MELGLRDVKQWDMTKEETAKCRSPYKMRELFSIIHIFYNPSYALSLRNKYKDKLLEDILHQYFKQQLENIITDEEINFRCLMQLEDIVINLGG